MYSERSSGSASGRVLAGDLGAAEGKSLRITPFSLYKKERGAGVFFFPYEDLCMTFVMRFFENSGKAHDGAALEGPDGRQDHVQKAILRNSA